MQKNLTKYRLITRLMSFKLLPNEVLFQVLKYSNLRDLSNFIQINKYINRLIERHKWDIIDNMYDRGMFIPKTLETYKEYSYCIDWGTFVMENMEIPEDIIVTLNQYMDFSLITTKQKLSLELLNAYYLRIPLYNLLEHQKIPIELLYTLVNLYSFSMDHWRTLWRKQPVDLQFMQTYEDKIDWYAISENKDALSINTLQYYGERFIWPEITKLGLHESIIEAFMHKMNLFTWINISYYSNLSKSFIMKYHQNLNTLALFNSQKLDEELVLFLLDQSDIAEHYQFWNKIALNQKLSITFIEKHKQHLLLHLLIRNKKIKRADLKSVFG